MCVWKAVYRFWFKVTHPEGDKGGSWWALQKKRKLENEATSQVMSLFHYFPSYSEEKPEASPWSRRPSKISSGLCPSSVTSAPVHLFTHWFLASPCTHQALTSGPLYVLILCQEKSPWQLHRSFLSLSRSLLKCHHQRAFLTLLKGSPSPHAIIHPSHHFSFLHITSFIHSFLSVFSLRCWHFVRFTAVSLVHRTAPGMW